MASTTLSTKTYSDDLAEGVSLPSGQRVGITVTDGKAVWVLDTARSNELVATLKAAGTKQKKRGRKATAVA
jgi:hypothetical protein